ncbi:hypothetical protein TRVL_09279 [Trypanosoma vivax]|nr:hypothetical protein TRVL_09279 [Trypanosoma vivax]
MQLIAHPEGASPPAPKPARTERERSSEPSKTLRGTPRAAPAAARPDDPAPHALALASRGRAVLFDARGAPDPPPLRKSPRTLHRTRRPRPRQRLVLGKTAPSSCPVRALCLPLHFVSSRSGRTNQKPRDARCRTVHRTRLQMHCKTARHHHHGEGPQRHRRRRRAHEGRRLSPMHPAWARSSHKTSSPPPPSPRIPRDSRTAA